MLNSGRSDLWKFALLPTLLGAWLGLASPAAHADCACNLTARLLTPEQVPGEICLDEDVDCVDGFFEEGNLEVWGEDLLLNVYIADDAYLLEAVP